MSAAAAAKGMKATIKIKLMSRMNISLSPRLKRRRMSPFPAPSIQQIETTCVGSIGQAHCPFAMILLVFLDIHRVAGDHIAVKGCAELGLACERIEIDVIEPKALLKTKDPFEIVHQAPEEIAAHRRTFGNTALQLSQVIAQKHDAVEVVDLAIGGDLIDSGCAVFRDVH